MVAVRKSRTKAEQREASTKILLEAALKLFVSQGYEQTTVDEVADRTSLSKGSVYFYFASKGGLLEKLFDEIEDVVIGRMLMTLSMSGPNARDKIAAFINGQAELGVSDPDHVLLLILVSLEFQGKGGPIEKRARRIYERMYRALEEVVAMGRKAGEFRTDLPLKEQVAIIVASHDGTFLEWHRRRKQFDGSELVRALRITMLGGLMPAQSIEE